MHNGRYRTYRIGYRKSVIVRHTNLPGQGRTIHQTNVRMSQGELDRYRWDVSNREGLSSVSFPATVMQFYCTPIPVPEEKPLCRYTRKLNNLAYITVDENVFFRVDHSRARATVW